MTFGPPSGAVSGIDTLSYLNQDEPRYIRKVIAQRAPTSRDKTGFAYGDMWINQTTDTSYQFMNVTAGAAVWEATAGGSAAVETITGDSGGALSPTAGNFNLLGTANQITVSGSGSTETWSIPSSFVAPGSVTATTTLTATLGNITATNGNLVLAHAGNKLSIHASTASSDSVGVTSAMSGSPGAVSVTTSACTTSSIILFSRATTGGTPGNVSITAQSNGSFTLTSTGNETSTFNYLIIN